MFPLLRTEKMFKNLLKTSQKLKPKHPQKSVTPSWAEMALPWRQSDIAKIISDGKVLLNDKTVSFGVTQRICEP